MYTLGLGLQGEEPKFKKKQGDYTEQKLYKTDWREVHNNLRKLTFVNSLGKFDHQMIESIIPIPFLASISSSFFIDMMTIISVLFAFALFETWKKNV